MTGTVKASMRLWLRPDGSVGEETRVLVEESSLISTPRAGDTHRGAAEGSAGTV